ncbi:endonuclease/exonuclease/phosphatase family protein [Streptomyces sp. ODS28]|uniref:endonuclease/exonuclease/phosphatase family protein n=1 Tax=Streptomyces sp. ODS28 TaxID=3136688 RepID=UPI0031EBDCB2
MLTGEESHHGLQAPDRRRGGPAGLRGGRRPRRRRLRLLAWAAWLTLAGMSLPLAARAADADGPTPLPQVLAFLPWFLVPGWLALLIGALARRWVLVCAAVLALAATGWFLRPYGPDAASGAEERASAARFRVLTANLQFGGATKDLVDTVRRERPQFVAVQECDLRCADALRSGPLKEAYPYRIIMGAGTDRSSDGSALLSEFPLRESEAVRGEMAMPGAVADVRGRSVRVQVAHPMPPEPSSLGTWRTELGRLRAFAAARGDTPTLMAGDFNSSQDHAAFRRILDTGMRDAARLTGQSRTPTWPSGASPLGAQIDHVLTSSPMTTVDARFLTFHGTDHRALLADIRLF